MRSKLPLIVAAPLALIMSVASAGACDPEDLKAEYRNLCATPTDAIAAIVEASASRLKPEMRAELIARARQAQQMCLDDKYDDAMKLAVRVARALGSAEQEAGLPREQLTQAPASTRVGSR